MLFVSVDSYGVKLRVKVFAVARNITQFMLLVSKDLFDIKLPVKVFVLARNIADFVLYVTILLHFVSVLLDNGQ